MACEEYHVFSFKGNAQRSLLLCSFEARSLSPGWLGIYSIPGWPQIHRDPPGSGSQVLRMKACTTTPASAGIEGVCCRPYPLPSKLHFVSVCYLFGISTDTSVEETRCHLWTEARMLLKGINAGPVCILSLRCKTTRWGG